MFNTPLEDAALVACLQCDLVQRVPDLVPGESARCPRCDRELKRRVHDSLPRSLALTLAAFFLYLISQAVPMLGLRVAGRQAFTTVFGGAMQLWTDQEKIVSVLVLFAAVLAPGLQILLLLAVLVPAMRGRPPHWVATMLRYHPVTRTWSMIEVMLLGVLVALVKIAELATVVPGAALFALGGLVVLFAAIQSVFDSGEIWERVQWANELEPAAHHEPAPHLDPAGERP